MTTDGRFDESISTWLEATAPSRLPERVLDATFEQTRRSRQQVDWRAVLGRSVATRPAIALGGAAVLVLAAVLTAGFVVDRQGLGAPPSVDPFLGTWVSTSDADGGTETMTVRAAADGAVEVVVVDDIASVCSRTPSTMTGTGRVEGSTKLVIPAPAYTCDDGSEPRVQRGALPLGQVLRNLTYVHHPESDILIVGFGNVWRRPDAIEPLSWHPSRFPGTWESAPGDTGFLGTWESTDIDGSSLRLGVRGAEASSDTFEVLLLDDRAGGGRRRWSWPSEACSYGSDTAGPITMTGIGRVDGPALAIGSQTWICTGESGPDVVSGDRRIEFSNAYTPLVHDPESDTLVGPADVVWHRRAPGSNPIAVPFWGVWPQSSLEEAEEAQRRADAGDPAFAWQLAPELATPPQSESVPIPARDAADGAEILARFVRDVLGWERYMTVSRRNPELSSDGPEWRFVRIRCGRGTNPLYPNDPTAGECPPTIDDSHYETVELRVMQPVRSGSSGIWVVTGWTELAPSGEPTIYLSYGESVSHQYEQVVPRTKAEVVEALEAFLAARVAGAGADVYLSEGYIRPDSHPTIPLLYATSKGDRYERFEIVSVQERPDWPAGDFGVEVRLFARGGKDVVRQELQVWPGSQGQLTLDSSITTENGEPVPDQLGSEE